MCRILRDDRAEMKIQIKNVPAVVRKIQMCYFVTIEQRSRLISRKRLRHVSTNMLSMCSLGRPFVDKRDLSVLNEIGNVEGIARQSAQGS